MAGACCDWLDFECQQIVKLIDLNWNPSVCVRLMNSHKTAISVRSSLQWREIKCQCNAERRANALDFHFHRLCPFRSSVDTFFFTMKIRINNWNLLIEIASTRNTVPFMVDLHYIAHTSQCASNELTIIRLFFDEIYSFNLSNTRFAPITSILECPVLPLASPLSRKKK